MMADRNIRREHALTAPRVYLLDGHEGARRGLHHLLESCGFSIAGESGSASEAVQRIPALRPDLVILDQYLPDGSGTDVCLAMAVAASSVRCLLLTADAGESVLIDSILAGACGCLSKQDDSREQVRLIRRALDGHTAYSSLFPSSIADPMPGPNRSGERLLTRVEMNAAIGQGRGLSNRQISQEMSLAEETVKDLTSSVLMKLAMVVGRRPADSLPKARTGSVNPGRRQLPIQPNPGSGRRSHASATDLHAD